MKTGKMPLYIWITLASIIVLFITYVLQYFMEKQGLKPMHIIATGGAIGAIGALIAVYGTLLHNKASSEKTKTLQLTAEQAVQLGKSIEGLGELNNKIGTRTIN